MNSDQLLQVQTKSGPHYLGPTKLGEWDIAQFYSPKRIIDEIYNENQIKNFTSILLIGSGGTGKTSLTTYLIHEFHKRKNYQVKWYGKDDIPHTIRILADLPSTDHILVFDDVSMALKRMKDQQKKVDILEALTEIRHTKDGIDRDIIVIANIHYLMALEKMWRGQGGWKIYTGLETEDKQNINQITNYKYQRWLDEFGGISHDMFRKGEFTVALTNKQDITYPVWSKKNPKGLRFAMVHDGERLRYFLYPRSPGCHICMKKDAPHKKIINGQGLVKVVDDEIGRSGLTVLKGICANRGYQTCWSNPMKNCYKWTMSLLAQYEVDLAEVADVLRIKAGIPYRQGYERKGKEDEFIRKVLEASRSGRQEST